MLETTDITQVDNNEMPKLRPLGVGELLDGTFSIYRRNFKLFIGIASLYFVANLIEYSIKGILANSNLSKLIAGITATPFAVLSMGGIVVAATTIYLGNEIKSGDALSQTFKRMWTLLYCYILYRLVIVVPLILITLSMGTVISSGSWALPILLAAIGIPFIIYFCVRWIFYVETILIEKYTGSAALGRSGELVQENWWKVLGIIILILISSIAIRYIFESSIGMILIIANLSGGTDFMSLINSSILNKVLDTGSYPFYVIMICSQMLLKSLVLPIWVIGVVLLYFDRRVRKEGYDIEITANDPEIII